MTFCTLERKMKKQRECVYMCVCVCVGYALVCNQLYILTAMSMKYD